MRSLWGLRARKAQTARNLQIKAQDAWAQIAGAEWNFADLLYGIWQDFSASKMELIVRNCHDEQVGKIFFNTVARKGWITLETAGSQFHADVLMTLRQEITLHSVGDESQVLCTLSRRQGGAYCFDAGSRRNS